MSCKLQCKADTYWRSRHCRVLNKFGLGIVAMIAPQHCHSSHVVESVIVIRLELRIVRCTEHCHQIALCRQYDMVLRTSGLLDYAALTGLQNVDTVVIMTAGSCCRSSPIQT